MTFHINGACWQHYPQDALQELLLDHPYLFPGYQKVAKVTPTFHGASCADAPYTDAWGCVWTTTENGIVGAVVSHPLADWTAFDGYTPPDARRVYDWAQRADSLAQSAAQGQIRYGGLEHGHTFLRVCDIHGYENVLMDMVDEEPRLQALLRMIETFNMTVVQQYLEIGVDWMSYPEDLGMQVGPMISPALFRQYIKPSYQRIMAPARAAGCVVHMHSDGDLHELADDLIDGGVTVLNLQDLVNGIDWIQAHFGGRICIDLDIDRQEITRFGTAEQIDALIRREVEALASKQGGLMMIYGLYPGVPLANVKALMDAMERYAGYYA
ncbi:MAG TPA: uroporphyrinogen decarboxylase family protein [Armatimonadota bacterium]